MIDRISQGPFPPFIFTSSPIASTFALWEQREGGSSFVWFGLGFCALGSASAQAGQQRPRCVGVLRRCPGGPVCWAPGPARVRLSPRQLNGRLRINWTQESAGREWRRARCSSGPRGALCAGDGLTLARGCCSLASLPTSPSRAHHVVVRMVNFSSQSPTLRLYGLFFRVFAPSSFSAELLFSKGRLA